MRYLTNLTSLSALPGKPWDFTKTEHIPQVVRTDKKIRDAWICSPSTEHHVYSLFEGVNENMRVSAPKADMEGNPPFKLFGLVGDYDAPIPEEELAGGCDRLAPYSPNYFERTLSGHARFIWVFEEPILLPSFSFAVFFLKEIQEKIKVHLLSVGFDRPAFEDPARLYTNSGEWYKLKAEPLNKGLVAGWLIQISQKFSFKGAEFGAEIPLEIVATELSKKFPKFAEWPGEFVAGAQGPSFWVEQSASPKSAIVRETGIQTFSAHAPKAFYSWSDLLGGVFVEEYESKAIGNAVTGIYHDGKNYHRTIGNNSWRAFSREDVCSHLAVTRGLSKKPDKQGISKIDRAIQHVQDFQSVIGVAPFVFQPAGLIYVDRQPVLNTHTRRVLTPAEGKTTWGKEFPVISKFLDGFFDPVEQLDYFLSWLSYFYKSCYRLAPRSGQNVFIAGSHGVGKTFINRGIIGELMGGCVEAKEYLLGEDTFGSELFEVAHWVVDDSSSNSSSSTHKKFSEMVKRMAANRTFRYHPKFRIPTMVNWQGRVVITCNRDEESIRIIPDLETSILDKLHLFRSTETPPIKWGSDEEMKKILGEELPYFARYLIDYVMPEHCVDRSDRGERFMVNAYHEKSLMNTAKQSSRYSGFQEIFEDWKVDYFASKAPEAPFWQGTSLQLHKSIMLDPTVASAMRTYTIDVVGRCLAQLKNKGEKIEADESGPCRVWKVLRTDGKQLSEKTVQSENITQSKFSK